MNQKLDRQLNSSIKLNERELGELASISEYLRKIYNKGYSSAWRMMWFYFLRGIAYGFGVFLGGTIVVSAVLGILSFFGIKLN